MMVGPCIRVNRSGPDMNHVSNSVPLAIELAHLLGIHIEDQRHLMLAFALLCLHKGHVETAARSGIQDAHQCSLCIAIADVKALHVVVSPNYCVGSSSSNISDKAAPAGTIGKTLASGAQSNTSSSGSGERKKRSI